MSVAPIGRLYHMDAVRCFCMLFGLMVHAATIGDNVIFELVKGASDLFRMSSFFVVSGFFSAMVLSRKQVAAFLQDRGRVILVPLVAGVLLLNPFTIFLVQRFHGGVPLAQWLDGAWRLPAPGPVVWHLHLWFLVSLAAYAACTPLLLGLARSRPVERVLNALIARAGPLVPLVLAVLTAVAVVGLRGVQDKLIGPFVPNAASFLVQVTIGYLPYFTLGVLAFAIPAMFTAIHRPFFAGLLVFGALLYFHGAWSAQLPPALERAGFWFSRAAFIYSAVTTILWFASKMVKRGSPLLSRLTEGVYSFYIFHYLFIYIIANLVALFTPSIPVIYILILLIGYPSLFLLHEKVIAPTPILRFLFNGKPLRSRKPASA